MLKKTLHTAMALIMMISITGLTIHKHYCADELTSISLFEDASDCHENTCAHCEEVTVSCKIDMDVISSTALIIPENVQVEISGFALLSDIFFTVCELAKNTKLSSEPPHLEYLHGIPMLQSFRC